MTVVIIDTACANLNSVRFALQRCGVDALVSADAEHIKAADKVILPGVGTAQAAMRNLHQLELVEVIRTLQQPVLGICLGMHRLLQVFGCVNRFEEKKAPYEKLFHTMHI